MAHVCMVNILNDLGCRWFFCEWCRFVFKLDCRECLYPLRAVECPCCFGAVSTFNGVVDWEVLERISYE